MLQNFILSVISDDKPGVVKQIAHTISEHNGSWLESRLTQLAGKFTGIIRVSVDSEHQDSLTQALAKLTQQGITINLETPAPARETTPFKSVKFSLAGPDRTGIVRELAQAFAQHSINVEEIATQCSSMPYSGDPLFEAEGTLQTPTNIDWEKFVEEVNLIADELALDIHLQPEDQSD